MLRNAAEYSPPRRGGVDAPSIKWIRSEIGAAGVVGSAKLFRPKHFAVLTTITASRYRARLRLLRWLRDFYCCLPLLCELCEEGNTRTQRLANSCTASQRGIAATKIFTAEGQRINHLYWRCFHRSVEAKHDALDTLSQ